MEVGVDRADERGARSGARCATIDGSKRRFGSFKSMVR